MWARGVFLSVRLSEFLKWDRAVPVLATRLNDGRVQLLSSWLQMRCVAMMMSSSTGL